MDNDHVNIEDVLEVLKACRLFSGLTGEELSVVAQTVELFQVKRGDSICIQGAQNDALWIVYSGLLYQTVAIGGVETFSRNLEAGEYWGQDCLHTGKLKNSVHVLKTSMLIRITAPKLRELAGRLPMLDSTLQILHNSGKITQRMSLDWLQPGEEVFYAGRRHPIFLFQKIAIPALIISVILFFTLVFLDALLAGAPVLFSIILVVCLAVAGWGGWSAVDWINDYSIVTSLRVVWLERVALIYDSRHEAPLSSLQSVDVQTTQLGRLMGYGNVFVRTISGPLVLPDVESPEDVAGLIYQHWELSKATRRKDEITHMEQTLRNRLKPETPSAATTASASVQEVVKPGLLQELFADFFKVRYETGGVVTYRKHWYVLVRKTWKPALALVVGLALWFGQLAGVYSFVPILESLLLLAFVLLGVATWWIYNYVDWRNDTYQITQDQIIDIERKPLGKEVKKVAQLDNILSIEYKRIGVMSIFLNFGTVIVAVGTSAFHFESVYNPSQVQQDLFAKMAAHQWKKKTDTMNEERERVGDWIATYHQHQDEYRTSPVDSAASPNPEELS